MIYKLDHIVPKDSDSTMVSNKVLTGKISLESRGLLCWFLTKSGDYEIKFPTVAAELGIKESRLSKLFKELVKVGFAYREVHRNSKGHVLGSEYHITEMPFYRPEKNTDIGKKPTFGKRTEIGKNQESDNSDIGKKSGSDNVSDNYSENQNISNGSPTPNIHRVRSKPNVYIEEDNILLNNNTTKSSSIHLQAKNTEVGKKSGSVELVEEKISFADFRKKYDKRVSETIWEMASKSWNELSRQEQVSAYQFLTDYVRIRIPKYRKHPHRYISLREWENPEVIQEISEMKKSQEQSNHQQFTQQNPNKYGNRANRQRPSRFTTSRPN